MVRDEEFRYEAVCCVSNLPRQSQHERQTRDAIGMRLARLMGIRFEEEEAVADAQKRYMVPSDTIIGIDEAARLGVAGDRDLFGGVVSHPFLATKAITHPLVEPGAPAPEGWSLAFGKAVFEVVLRGFTAFSFSDARSAGVQLLREGPIRLKQTSGQGGSGQATICDVGALERALEEIDPREIESTGLVLEENLSDVTTFSVGQVCAADLMISYRGTQRLTKDNRGRTVYGGSSLDVVRDGWDDLLNSLSKEEGIAVTHARRYDASASACFPGFLASRRNYDVALGTNQRGSRVYGVLEQSWRLGGATPAEILAIEALKNDPDLTRVRACTAEIYGALDELSPKASVFFSGDDADVGPITKFAWLEHGSN